MGNVDYMIVYYLCGIMVVLALIIAIGAGRKRKKAQNYKRDTIPDQKD